MEPRAGDPIPDALGYDEVGTRTRQAWLRTSLVVIVVTLLAERALIIGNQPWWVLALPLIPSAGLLAIAALRSHRLRRHESDAVPRVMIILTVSCVVTLALLIAFGIGAATL